MGGHWASDWAPQDCFPAWHQVVPAHSPSLGRKLLGGQSWGTPAALGKPPQGPSYQGFEQRVCADW